MWSGVMHYALCKIWAISLCTKLVTVVKRCIMENMHYEPMHYEKVYCTSLKPSFDDHPKLSLIPNNWMEVNEKGKETPNSPL